jgi:pyruvate formate lyase activating enzyme
MMAKIFAIKRFAVHDGDGIRTTVFFKGCPLNCVWCHNPEGIGFGRELAIYEHKCIGCGECASCPEGAIVIVGGKAITDREKCAVCGECADKCIFSARELFGKEVDVTELAKTLAEDKVFFESSGGGVTLSGGECLSQPDFALELLKELKKAGIHTAVDTCGYVPREIFDRIIPFTDVFLYDIKAYSSEIHKKCTGRDNALILSNFEYLCSHGCAVEVRIPLVVGENDGEIEDIGRFLKDKPIKKVTVLQYHDLARSKYSAVNKADTMPENGTAVSDVEKATEVLRKMGIAAVSGRDD